MDLTLMITISLILVVFFAYRIYISLPGLNPKKRVTKKPIHTMIVLGSGGHTGEMMPLVESLSKQKNYEKFTFIHAESDTLSAQHPSIPNGSEIVPIPRSRKVGQSFFSSIFTTLYSIIKTFPIILKKPDLLLVNGPGVCLPVVLIIFIGNVIGMCNCTIVFVESFCRVDTLSLTGKIIYPLCDIFLVHWPKLVGMKKRARLINLFGLNKEA